MADFRVFLRCVGEAVVAHGLKRLSRLAPFDKKQLYQIASDANRRYKDCCRQEEAVAQVEAVAQASREEIPAAARGVFAEIRAAAPAEVAAQLGQPAVEKPMVAYLEIVPTKVRHFLRRSADPSGRSVPKGFSVEKLEDFLGFLPKIPLD
jgi:hypothetical protein